MIPRAARACSRLASSASASPYPRARVIEAAGLSQPIGVAFGARRFDERQVLPRQGVIRHEPQRLVVAAHGLLFTARFRQCNRQVIGRDVVARIEIGRTRPERD